MVLVSDSNFPTPNSQSSQPAEAVETKTTASLTPAQAAYVELDKRYASEFKPFLDELKAAREAVIGESGIGAFFQDDAGTVYYTAPKKGQWIDFTPHEIQRTRREGESKGTLSLTAAKEAGFEVS
jgi:hypothetical protein